MAKKKKYSDPAKPFKWKHYTGEIILWLVTWYGRYALSYRDLKEMAAERGLMIDRSTIYRWVQEYSPEISDRIKPYLCHSFPYWKLDETYIKIKGKWRYLYRAIDKKGDTLDWMLSLYRNKKAAKRFFKKLLGNVHVTCPKVINTDKNPTFSPALKELQATCEFPNKTQLRPLKYLNNRLEGDHKSIKSKSRYRQWYQSFKTARNAIAGMETMRLIQKGQLISIGKEVRSQIKFLNNLFGLAA